MSKDFLPAFVIGYSDSSFTNPHEVVLPDEPPDCSGSFTHMGAKYRGYETRRHRAMSINEDSSGFHFDHDAHHWLRIGLKSPAMVRETSLSTKWFTGNQVPEVSITLFNEKVPVEVLTRTSLAPDSDHIFPFEPTEADECLVKCFHEGGIARINLFGESLPTIPRANLLERANISHISNEHYGKPADAVGGNREVNYMHGWESARSGFGEQALFHLEQPAVVDEFVVDTYMHRLNPPLSCHVYGLPSDQNDDVQALMEHQPRWIIEFDNGESYRPANFQSFMLEQQYLKESASNRKTFSIRLVNNHVDIWQPLITFGRLFPDQYHRFTDLQFNQPVSHLLYMHYPNGGVHGLKAFGLIKTIA